MTTGTTIELTGLVSFTIAILVYFAGAGLNRAIAPLARWNIPEAVTGGLLAALITLLAFRLFDAAVVFDLEARDLLLLYFFTGIGLNARLSDLVTGGRPLVILLLLTVAYLAIQNLIAVGSVAALGLPEGLAPLLGSVALIGGHGTAIAWAPLISERFGLAGTMEIGVAAATLGLILASLMGGPIAGYLLRRHKLAGPATADRVVGLPEREPGTEPERISHVSILSTLLILNLAIIMGVALEEALEEATIKLPLFVLCLLSAIVLTNTVPRLLPGVPWPTRTRALALISDLSLNVFLAMSLMSMQLWTLGGLGFALVIVLGLQAAGAALYILFVVFPAMGRDYQAAVLSSGFTGISLGATPTAIANMTAVTKQHGAAPTAFIILPLVSAFFIDIANAVAIGVMIR